MSPPRGQSLPAATHSEAVSYSCNAALAVGIPREDIYIDCLTLTASAQQEGAVQTLEALSRCKHELGVRTVLGVSNISFGLQ